MLKCKPPNHFIQRAIDRSMNASLLILAIALGGVPDFALAQTAKAEDWVEWSWSAKDLQEVGENVWPQYRGLHGDGHGSPRAQPPINWGETTNLTWKLPVNGKAWSSPVVWGNRLWITNASTDGKTMSALCIDRATGKVVWDRVLFQNESTQKDYHEFNSYGSPTPVVDSKHLFVTFGAYGTTCLDSHTGEKIWERKDLSCNHYRGAGSSPILFRDTLLFHMDGFDFQYVIALDRATGQTRWKVDRQIDYQTDNGDLKKAFSTPHVIQIRDGNREELQLISPAAKAIVAYNPTDGSELWKVRYDEHSAALRPLFDGQFVFTTTGFSKGKLLAIRPIGTGDVTESQVVWTSTKSIGAKPSPLLIGDNVITLEDRGVITSLNKSTGEVVWQKRLGGDFSSSPIFAGGNIYCLDEQGRGHVLSPTGEVLATNTLPSGCLASPASVGSDLYIRTRDALYCFRR